MKPFEKLILILHIIIITTACDQFSEDVEISKEDIVKLGEETITTTYNSPVVINLQGKLNSSEVTGVRTSLFPKHGTLEISQNGIIVYSKNNATDTPPKDIFALDFLRQDSSIIDSDTIEITFVSDTSQLSCNNGALSDFINTTRNSSINFNVLWNDGYCPDETKDVLIEIIEQPTNGSVISNSSDGAIPAATLPEGTISYQPNSDFIGKDKFLYKLTLTDNGNIMRKSFAFAYINILSENSCQDKANNDSYTYFDDTSGDFSFTFSPLDNDIVCEGTKLEMGQPNTGEISELAPGKFSYEPSPSDCAIKPCNRPDDIFNYTLVSESGARTGATITISFSQDSSACDALPNAVDDIFRITELDYDTGSNEPDTLVELNVLANDTWCSSIKFEDLVDRTYENGQVSIKDEKLVYLIFDHTMAIDEEIEYTIFEIANPSNRSTASVLFSYIPDSTFNNNGDMEPGDTTSIDSTTGDTLSYSLYPKWNHRYLDYDNKESEFTKVDRSKSQYSVGEHTLKMNSKENQMHDYSLSDFTTNSLARTDVYSSANGFIKTKTHDYVKGRLNSKNC